MVAMSLRLFKYGCAFLKTTLFAFGNIVYLLMLEKFVCFFCPCWKNLCFLMDVLSFIYVVGKCLLAYGGNNCILLTNVNDLIVS